MKYLKIISIVILISHFFSCSPSKNERAETLFQQQCANCHMAPKPQDLPKHIWVNNILPEMAARMGIKESSYSPYKGKPFQEQEMMMRSGIYNVKPSITKEDWALLKDYIIGLAPDSLSAIPKRTLTKGLPNFSSRPVNLDSLPQSSFTFLSIDTLNSTIMTGDISGIFLKYSFQKNKIIEGENFGNPLMSYNKKDAVEYYTTVGQLNPSEIAIGSLYKKIDDTTRQIINKLHRPVFTSVYDFNKDDSDEILISEFGNLRGGLSLWKETTTGTSLGYEKELLLGNPGIIRTIIKDMNADGKEDIIVLSSQGNENVSILYQNESLKFKAEEVFRFSPVYGTSWFEVLDYNGDGYNDIITVHGDNADNSYVAKPYHGMRIHINNGSNEFEEKLFYPMYGATRFVAKDFDKDGDVDIALISSFPDYQQSPEFSFVFLHNVNSEKFEFNEYGLKAPFAARWLLIDSGDLDEDGDEDIVISSFAYNFTPVPKQFSDAWKKSNVDLLILENKLENTKE